MKNSKMIIAVFAVVVSAAVSAKAQAPIDFDGKGSKSMNFAEALEAAQAAPQAAVKYELMHAVSQELPGRPAPQFTDKQVNDMDKSIGTAIAYVREQKLPDAFADGFTCLLQRGTPAQKAEFVNRPEGVEYSLPGACISQNKGVCTWVVQKVCEMVMDPKTDIEKNVCTLVKFLEC